MEPGGRNRVLALVRNQSSIVDNYELSVRGLPDDWWSIFPNTVYLVPFGTSGTYEQEVEIHLHPPRTPEAEARIWELEVVGQSKAYSRQAAAAPLKLGILPFEEFKTKLAPERVSGRKKANFDVAVNNTANGPLTVALDAADQDNELKYAFSPATLEIPPGKTGKSKLQVKPPRTRWIGRPEEKRIQVFTKTGDEAEQAKTAEDMDLPEGALEEGEDGEGGGHGAAAAEMGKTQGKRMLKRIRGPKLRVGPSGVRMQGPGFTRPAVPGGRSVDLMKLRKPGTGAPMPQMPLMPNQVVFRHKAWLPWWVAVLIPLLLLLALLLFLFLPRNVVVPDVTGTKSAFEAEKKLTKAQLKLAPTTKEKVSTAARARHRDRPDPGRRREGEEGLRGHDRDRGRQRQGAGAGHRRQDAGRSGPDPREGEPHDRPGAAAAARPEGQDREPDPRRQGGGQGGQADQHLPGHDQGQEERRARTKKDGGGGGGGGGKAAAVTLPALGGAVADAAQAAADAGVVPGQGHRVLAPRRRARSSAPSRPRAPSSRRATRSRSSSPAASRS